MNSFQKSYCTPIVTDDDLLCNQAAHLLFMFPGKTYKKVMEIAEFREEDMIGDPYDSLRMKIGRKL